MTIVLSDLPTAVQEAVATTRQRVADLHAELPRNELVVWTAGNVSERVPMPTEPAADSRQLPGLFVITPDRKSTRLNSSHVAISYAVFCLKKKQENDPRTH